MTTTTVVVVGVVRGGGGAAVVAARLASPPARLASPCPGELQGESEGCLPRGGARLPSPPSPFASCPPRPPGCKRAHHQGDGGAES
eukprot:scaffold1104_cov299-Prasinococcus_capsulatus_cf.AAC.24